MSNKRFYYQILRYIPDLNRMEPRNFGIVLQSSTETIYKINTRFAQRGFVDTEAFRKWKKFIDQEVSFDDTKQLQMFCPPKHTHDFLIHLQKLIQGNFNITKPLLTEFHYERNINDVLIELFNDLVMEKEDLDATEVTRPTGKFRAASEEKKFIRRGLKENAHVDFDSGEIWIGYRIYENGSQNIIEKVEFNRNLRRTAEEINALLRFVPIIPEDFLQEGN
ncbi:MAG: hypothetical protein FJ088_01345 [Deltaproteobacteria bacterium]|nr:hypothetical protein [Deltaproteobacteria bacterium]